MTNSGRFLGVTITVLALSGVACGTRVESDKTAAPTGAVSGTSASPAGRSAVQAVTESSVPEAAGPVSSVPGGNDGSGSPAKSTTAAPVRSGGTSSQPSAGSAGTVDSTPTTGPSGRGVAPATPGVGTPQGGGAAGGTTPTPAGATVKASPVVVASVGTYSGPAGTVIQPVMNGAQIWAKAVNDKGGLNGHPVKFVVYDDGGDSARHRAQVQEAVERQNAIAFLGQGDALTGAGSISYLESKRVPVIGTDSGGSWNYTSPMFFPPYASNYAFLYAALAMLARVEQPKGHNKLGTIFCSEVETCTTGDANYAKWAKGLGFDHVYRGRVSLAQPDFTAECLSARNAGVNVFVIGTDTNSVFRVGASCARQGYHPTFMIFSTVVDQRHQDDPNLDGMLGMSNAFPWFAGGTPATDEFQSSVRRVTGKAPTGVGMAMGWTAGKLLEKAAARLPEPATSAAVLAGLWTITNDTLGDLTIPLTFRENKPAEPKACWFTLVIERKAWKSLDRQASCADLPQQ